MENRHSQLLMPIVPKKGIPELRAPYTAFPPVDPPGFKLLPAPALHPALDPDLDHTLDHYQPVALPEEAVVPRYAGKYLHYLPPSNSRSMDSIDEVWVIDLPVQPSLFSDHAAGQLCPC